MITCATPNFAVVGAAGFLGRVLSNHLAVRGHAFTQFTRNAPAVCSGKLASGVHEASCVVWLASSINPLVAESHPELIDADFADLASVVLRVAELPTPPRFILLSSGGTVYGPASTPPHAETALTQPATAYGAAKLRMEQEVLSVLQDVCVLRVANAYGPGQPVAHGQGVIAHWMKAARRREPIRVYGDVRTVRDYVFAADVADAIERASVASTVPPVLNIGSGQPTSLADLLHLVLRVVNQESVLVDYAHARSFDVPANYLDISLAAQALEWMPRTSLEDGLTQTWDAVRCFGDVLS